MQEEPLGQKLNEDAASVPKEYKFFPKTWLLPSEMIEFKNSFSKSNGKSVKLKSKKTFIVKPEALSQGKGIFLTRKMDEILDSCKEEGCVV